MSETEVTAGRIQPKISIVVVSYFTGPLLDRAIDSALAQDIDLELKIVSNGNPEEVTKNLRVLAERDRRVEFLSGHGNIGFARGCNLGARASRGELLLLLNPDAELPAHALRDFDNEARGLKRPWMLGARLINPDGSEQRGGRREELTPWAAIVEGSQLYRLFPNSKSFARFNKNEDVPPKETRARTRH